MTTSENESSPPPSAFSSDNGISLGRETVNLNGGVKVIVEQNNQHASIETNWNKLDKSKYYSIGVIASYGLRSIFFPISLIGSHQVANLNVCCIENQN